MRQERIIQASLFDIFATHEIGRELKQISQWLDQHRALLGLVSNDLRRDGVPGKLLAWRSVGEPAVQNAGIVRFDELPNGATRVMVRLSYHPPGGGLGHAFARLLGADPKREMDDDLLRFKSLIESGQVRGHGSRVTREELAPREHQPPGLEPSRR